MHTYIHTYIHIYIYVCIYMYVCVCACVCMYNYIYIYVFILHISYINLKNMVFLSVMIMIYSPGFFGELSKCPGMVQGTGEPRCKAILQKQQTDDFGPRRQLPRVRPRHGIRGSCQKTQPIVSNECLWNMGGIWECGNLAISTSRNVVKCSKM